MKILIAEDDLSSRKLLKHFILRIPNYELVGEATNGEELIRYIITEKPDLALVDIEMPLLNGMEAIKSCKDLLPNLQVIFITGNENFAVEAFYIKALDYIIKPIESERLYDALERAAQISNYHTEEPVTLLKKELMIKQQQNIDFIPLKEIIFIERANRKSIIHTKIKQFVTSESLTNLEGLLDSRFFGSHRSYIINVDLLSRIETSGQMYKAYFRNYSETARISKHKILELQQFKSMTQNI